MADVIVIGTNAKNKKVNNKFEKTLQETIASIPTLEISPQFVSVILVENKLKKRNPEISIYVILEKTETDLNTLQDIAQKIEKETRKIYPKAPVIKVKVPPYDSSKFGSVIVELVGEIKGK